MRGQAATGLEGHQEGDRIVHLGNPNLLGTIHHVDPNKLSVLVIWDGEEDQEASFAWANQVTKVEK